MKKPIPYNSLALMPGFIARLITTEPYTGGEMTDTSPSTVERREALRQAMHPADVEEFSHLVDKLCRNAYKEQVGWFTRCLNGNAGRDALHNVIKHWLAAYLEKPYDLRRMVERGKNAFTVETTDTHAEYGD